MNTYVKIVHAQTIMTEQQLTTLKRTTGEPHTKDALITAVEYYLKSKCEN
ncbi:hypothetical protein J2755_001826 [Methanohalophilus levihalophilus]|nr:DUF5371 family protein [Methanohalophilus levihalophilus]MBP2030878.1 hypothetical protein [Methanohalophilus levihalophilus]